MDAVLTTTGIYSTFSCDMDDDSLTTVVAATATTATATPMKVVVIEDTIAYVESLSDEQLEKLSIMLDEKETLIESGVQDQIIEKPKIHIKQDK